MCSEQDHHAIITNLETNEGGVTKGIILTAFLVLPTDEEPNKLIKVAIDSHGLMFQLTTRDDEDVVVMAEVPWDALLKDISDDGEKIMASSLPEFNTVADLLGDIE